MDEDGRNRQRVSDVAGVLTTGAAKAIERVTRDVVAPRDRNRLDRLGHPGDSDGEKAVGDRLRRPPVADVVRERRKTLTHDLIVERLVALRAEHFRKQIGNQLARHQIGVSDREGTAATISRGSGIGAGRRGANAKTRAVE